MLLKMLAAPLIGGLIGYITNDIAVKMLFRPRSAVYIGHFHVPFTPGLIPRQRERIAASLGAVVANQLMNRDTIAAAVTSPGSVASVRAMFGKMAEKWKNDTRSVRYALKNYATDEEIDNFAFSLREKLTDDISEKINDADIGSRLLQGERSLLLHGMIRESIINFINKLISDKLPDIIYDEIERTENDILEMRLCDIYTRYEDKMPMLTDKLTVLYETAALKNIDRVLKIVDIEHMVGEKVMSFDAEQLEKLIFGIMHKELRAIVYFGAMLGFLMGFVNILFFI